MRVFTDRHWYFYVSPLILMVVLVTWLAGRIQRTELSTGLTSGINILWAIVSIALFCGPARAFGLPLPGSLIPRVIPQFRHGDYSAQLLVLLLLISIAEFCPQLINGILKVIVGGVVVIAFIALPILEAHLDTSGGRRWMTPISIGPATERLITLPKGPVANYPWELSKEMGNTSDATPCLRAWKFKMPLVNVCDYALGTTTTIEHVLSVSTCDGVTYLQAVDVRYIVIDFASSQPVLVNCLRSLESRTSTVHQYVDGEQQLWDLQYGL